MRRSGGRIADQRRRDLLTAAFALVAEKGLEGLRTRDVAAGARVNVSTLHYYFATKDDLIVALVQFVGEKFAAALPEIRTRAGQRAGARAPEQSPRPHLEAAWRTLQAAPDLSTVLHELGLRGHRDPATRAAFHQVFESWNQAVEQALAADRRAGALRADLDTRTAARIVTSFVMGAMMQLGATESAFDFTAVARKLERLLRTRST